MFGKSTISLVYYCIPFFTYYCKYLCCVKTNSWGVLTAYFGKETFTVEKNHETDKEYGTLIL